ncbi:MAG: HD domain-containing protein [Gemmatimonadaceae bacterium]|nr:HD domain-containing protein [Gemmatimonadaceae bacterium]
MHPIDPAELHGILTFLRRAEALKMTTRTSWTSDGAPETVASHTWRLCLMAMVLAPCVPGIDLGKLLRICVVHDLGEAIGGDISAVLQAGVPSKAAQERADLLELTKELPVSLRDELVALWDEYESASSPEARLAKGLDKLETILQHNQGAMPAGFDFRFNLGYGATYTSSEPALRQVREVLDGETERRALEREDERREDLLREDVRRDGV